MGWFSSNNSGNGGSDSSSDRSPQRGSAEEIKQNQEIKEDFIKEHVIKGDREDDFDGI